MLRSLGMSQPTDLYCARPELRGQRVRLTGVLGAGLLLATAHCTFPEYDIRPPSSAGSGATSTAGTGAGAGGGAVAGAAGKSGGGGGSNGGEPSTGAAAGEGGGGSGPDPACEPEQWPVDRCAARCLHRFPDHCYDGEMSGDESALDCGGSCQGCTIEACNDGADCLSGVCDEIDGACFAPVSLKLTHGETNSIVGSTTWSVTLRNEQPVGGKSYPLASLKVRYYLDRSGIFEPLVVRATQANLILSNGESRGLQKREWLVQRVEHPADSVYDAYVEVTFSEGGALFPGDRIELYQQLQTGDPGRSPFDQRANYSFTGPSDEPGLHMTVFSGNKLLWGLEPQPANPQTCFVRGVNLNGGAVTVDGHAWESSQTALVTTSGEGVIATGATYPATSGGTLSMLNTFARLETNEALTLPTVNGTYLVYLFAISQRDTTDPEANLLTVQGEAPDSSGAFRSQTVDGGPVWAKLGPYRVDVTDGTLAFAVTKGAVNLAGLELWYPE
jgi:hypothetical protein